MSTADRFRAALEKARPHPTDYADRNEVRRYPTEPDDLGDFKPVPFHRTMFFRLTAGGTLAVVLPALIVLAIIVAENFQ